MKGYLVLHVGMPKAGSTAIQWALSDFLEDPSFEYLRLGDTRDKDCNHLFSLFSANPEKYYVHERLKADPAQIKDFNKILEQELIEKLARLGDKNCIMSGEALILLGENELLNLREFLNRYFAKILVVAYVRPPRSYMESAFQQAVKGRRLPYDDIGKQYPAYRFKLQNFDRVFGKDNVSLWKFDSGSLLNGDVVEDFCHRLGIKIASERTHGRNNVSLSGDAVKLLYTYRTYYPYGKGNAAVRANNRIVGALNKIKGKRLRFSPKVIGPLFEQKREDIAWIEARMGVSLAEKMEAEDDDIASVADLLAIDDATIEKLRPLFGNQAPSGIGPNLSPKQVADLIHALAKLLAVGLDTEPTDEDILKSLVQQAVLTAQQQLGNLSEARAIALLKAVFADVALQVDAATGGSFVEIPALGRFEVHKAEAEKEKEKGGKKDSAKHIVFIPAKNRD